MGRVPEAEIERLKREVSLERLVEARGIKLDRTGANLVGLCPFHDDRKTPNLVVTPEKNIWHCFVCQVGGSVIDWVMKTQGASFRHAIDVSRHPHGTGPEGFRHPHGATLFARVMGPPAG